MPTRTPIYGPGKLQEVSATDVLGCGGLSRASGALTFTDSVTGTKTLGELVAGAGGIGGTVGTTANALVRASGTGGTTLQGSSAILDGSGNLSGIGNITLSGTVDGRDVSTDGATLDTHVGIVAGNPHGSTAAQVGAEPAGAIAAHVAGGDVHTVYQLKAARGAALGYAGLDASLVLQNPAPSLRETGGPTTLALSAIADGQLLQRSGTSLIGTASPTLTGATVNGNITVTGTVDGRDVSADWTTTSGHIASTILHLPASLGAALQQLRMNAGGTAPEWATISGAGEVNTSSNAGASGTGIALAKSGVDLPFAKILGTNGIAESLASSVLSVSGAALLPRDGTRAMTAALDMGTFGLLSLGYQTISPTAIAASTNDWTPTSWSGSERVRVTLTGNQTVTGFSSTATATRKLLVNVDSADTLTISHESASSTAANRVSCPGAVDFALAPLCSVILDYDATSSRWRVIESAVATAAPSASVLHAIQRSAQLTNITSAIFPGFDTVLQAINSSYWTYSSGTWTCAKAHTSMIDTTMSYKVNAGAVAAVACCDIVWGTGGSFPNVLQTMTDSAYSTTDTNGTLRNIGIRSWAVNDQMRIYYYTTTGAMDILATQNVCYIRHVSG